MFVPHGWRASTRKPLEHVVLPALLALGGLAVAGIAWPALAPFARRNATPLLSRDPGRSPEATPPRESAPSTAMPLPGLDVLPRRLWSAARPAESLPPLGAPDRVTVHHSGLSFHSTDIESTTRRIRAIQEYHMKTRGWLDIAYHFVIDRAGRIWEGRPIDAIGAHAGSAEGNCGNVGIALLGNYETQEPTAAQEKALVALLERACEVWRIPRDRVATHSEFRVDAGLDDTVCPGKHVTAVVARFREER